MDICANGVQHTTVGQFSPNAIHTRQVGLATKTALCSDFLGQECYLTGKVLQLVHHAVDGALEQCNFGVHLLGVYQNLLAQIAHSDSRDNASNLA